MRHILPVILLAICQPLFAQIDKGSTLLGGSFGFGAFNNNSNSTSSNSNLNPFIQFGYKANRTIGFSANLNYSSRKNHDANFKNEQFGFGPSIIFTQYHPLKGNFGWLLNQYVRFGYSTNKNTNNSIEEKSSITSLSGGIMPGIYYVAGDKKNWLLQATFGDLSANQTWESNDRTSFNIGTSFFQYYNFGFAYIFNK